MLNQIVTFFLHFSEKIHNIGSLIILPITILLVTGNVMFRYAFNAPFAWGEEINGFLLFLLLFLTMTYTWDQNKHIRIEIIYGKLKGRIRIFADLLASLAGIIFFGLMGIQSIGEISYMIKTNETGQELSFPLWPFRALLALISFVFVFKLVVFALRGVKGKNKEAEGAKRMDS